jgi:hypothetical protein
LLICGRLSKKQLLFKSFIGLTVQEFDDIYDKEIVKGYQTLSKTIVSARKDVRKRKAGAIGLPFKLFIKEKTDLQCF